jgi:hypothetical protein
MITIFLALCFVSANSLAENDWTPEQRQILAVIGRLSAITALGLLAVVMDADTAYPRGIAVWASGRIGDMRTLDPLQGLHAGRECDQSEQLCQRET